MRSNTGRAEQAVLSSRCVGLSRSGLVAFAFLAGLIHCAIENNRITHDYLVNYKNAAFIVANIKATS